ncbi:Release factor glutamine methyltransferase [Actinomadura rubteroloni]|uniref:peptide chain release factor N(5)-glutamine methyltransferase n=1 Tax=Actinomadura rubteroloni TaxID=1926885 RepID=A0A2P4UKR1_9ACTN|nr:putative protein N(5)-glutamine methyltransferase [Actinomadura rubteroloni]POM25616.1 Release factor glutamine methyltransferase [Actinomadura rubteroloni]
MPEYSEIVTRLRAAGCVFAEDEARLIIETAAPDERAAMVERRAAGLPLEHVLGWAAFGGLRIHVDPGVFVPRRRTEFLLSEALAHPAPRPLVVDLCCGTGALGAAFAAARPGADVYAADVDPAAVACARRNLPPERCLTGDLFAPLPAGLRGRVDVLLSNVPYVPTGDIELLPSEARDHEARVALDGGGDGLDLLRRVAAEAPAWLAPGGLLLFETTERQAPEACAAVAAHGLAPRVARCDYATVIVAARPAAS